MQSMQGFQGSLPEPESITLSYLSSNREGNKGTPKTAQYFALSAICL